jgi:UDP-N-acetylglucosamine--N-acetylmuramyl-(pentapeptide) pyrophosphoryl-undecaprenol N-acetylglucosamine transferase
MTCLFIAATGGHLDQLIELAPRIAGCEEAVWVTFDAPQSRSLLTDREHIFVPYTAPRDVMNVMRNVRLARRVLAEVQPSLVASTGNAIALAYLPLAATRRIPAAYIESAARAEGPSVTGRILQRIPRIELYSQYETWATPPWQYAGSVFDRFKAISEPEVRDIKRVAVTLGTIRYGFRRLVERVHAIVPTGCHIFWQVGSTDVSGLGIEAHLKVSPVRMRKEMMLADVVIAHAGVGSALGALSVGKTPVLVPRERSRGEHIDDHQRQIAVHLDRLGLARYRTVAELELRDLKVATGAKVVSLETLPPLPLVA